MLLDFEPTQCVPGARLAAGQSQPWLFHMWVKVCMFNLQPACTFAHKCLCLSTYAGWIHAFTACVRQDKQFYDTYSCPYNPPYDVCFPAGQQFYCAAHVGLSVSPSPVCISRWSTIFPCPDCFIMTYFDYLSQGTHNGLSFATTDKKKKSKRKWERKRHEQRDSNQGMFPIVLALCEFKANVSL